MIDATITLNDQYSETLKKVNRNLSKFQEQVNRIGKSMDNVGEKLNAHLCKPLEKLGEGALKANSDFSSGMINISKIVDNTKVSLEKLSRSISHLSDKPRFNSEKTAHSVSYIQVLNSVKTTSKGARDCSKELKAADKASALPKEASKKMQMPGEKFRDATNKLKDDTKKLRDSASIMGQITPYISKVNDALKKLTPAQKESIANFMLIAGVMGPIVSNIKNLKTSIGNTIETFRNLSKSVKDAGGFMKFLATPGMKIVLVMVAIALVALFVIKNWSKIKDCFKNVAKSISQVTGISKEDVQKFGAFIGGFLKIIGGKLKEAFSGLGKQILPPLKKLFETLKRLFATLKPILMPILKFIVGIFVLRICRSLSIITTVVSAVIKTIGAVIGGLIEILNGVINFIIGVFTGNWKRSWNGIKSILSGVMKILHGLWEGFIDWITAPVQAVVDILDAAFKNKVKWIKDAWEELKEFFKHPIKATVDLLKQAPKPKTVKTPYNALGTSYWSGGETWVGEHGPEKVWLPSGSKVMDHRNSMKNGNSPISIAKLADTIVVREDADIDKIANLLVRKLQKTSYNMA